MVNTPHNPTRMHLTRDELDTLVEICEDNGLLLFSDEVYRFGEYSANDLLPSATDLSETAVSLGVLSKPFGPPGLRIGWIATKSAKVMRKLEVFKDYTTICNSAPSEQLAILAIRNKEPILRRNRSI